MQNITANNWHRRIRYAEHNSKERHRRIQICSENITANKGTCAYKHADHNSKGTGADKHADL